TQAKWSDDKFALVSRTVSVSARTGSPTEELHWRIECFDCPGKLYIPGPGETLSNYEVHLKNRLHRRRVDERVGS
ncbi:hypothetical protein B0H13DRAFT_1527796, partial [Mycena leptocephala]